VSLANLSLAQLLALVGGGSALLVALYLLDRARQRRVVATLRFWVAAQRPPETRHRRRIQQWRSLLLQLLALVLLALAIAELSCGPAGPAARDHVLILDTSAWMAARSARGNLMEQARELARAWVRGLPSRDRVMVLRADALATPATVFEADRSVIARAISQSQPSATALRLRHALEFAARSRSLSGGSPGELIFVGAGRVSEEEASGAWPLPAGLRTVLLNQPLENCGLRRIGLVRSTTEPARWEVVVSVRNYGLRQQRRLLRLTFGGAPVGETEVWLAPAQEQQYRFSFRSRAAGWLEARLWGNDALQADDHAVLEVPELHLIHVLAYTAEPELWRPLFSSNPWVRAEYRPPGAFDPRAPADVVILDGFRPPEPPAAHTVWIDPPVKGAPVEIRGRLTRAKLTRWRTDHALGAGIRAHDLELEQANILVPSPGDVVIAEASAQPVILARDGPRKLVVLGFHPQRSSMRYEVTAPLLFANMLRWMAPEPFRRWEAHAQSAGTFSADLGDEPAELRVITEDGRLVPFTRSRGQLRLFSANAHLIRVLAPGSELVFSLSLPQIAEAQWEPPPGVRRGVPARAFPTRPTMALWPWLALAGGACILAEWLAYGPFQRARVDGRWAGSSWRLAARRAAAFVKERLS